MWALFIKGGPIMFPLALLSILGVGVVIEKLITLRNRRVLTPEIINSIRSLQSPSDIPMALRATERYNSPLAHIVRAGLEEAESPIADVRLVMEDTGRREVKRLERYLVVLETVAAASPLLGLLGTVLGMIKGEVAAKWLVLQIEKRLPTGRQRGRNSAAPWPDAPLLRAIDQ